MILLGSGVCHAPPRNGHRVVAWRVAWRGVGSGREAPFLGVWKRNVAVVCVSILSAWPPAIMMEESLIYGPEMGARPRADSGGCHASQRAGVRREARGHGTYGGHRPRAAENVGALPPAPPRGRDWRLESHTGGRGWGGGKAGRGLVWGAAVRGGDGAGRRHDAAQGCPPVHTPPSHPPRGGERHSATVRARPCRLRWWRRGAGETRGGHRCRSRWHAAFPLSSLRISVGSSPACRSPPTARSPIETRGGDGVGSPGTCRKEPRWDPRPRRLHPPPASLPRARWPRGDGGGADHRSWGRRPRRPAQRAARRAPPQGKDREGGKCPRKVGYPLVPPGGYHRMLGHPLTRLARQSWFVAREGRLSIPGRASAKVGKRPQTSAAALAMYSERRRAGTQMRGWAPAQRRPKGGARSRRTHARARWTAAHGQRGRCSQRGTPPPSAAQGRSSGKGWCCQAADFPSACTPHAPPSPPAPFSETERWRKRSEPRPLPTRSSLSPGGGRLSPPQPPTWRGAGTSLTTPPHPPPSPSRGTFRLVCMRSHR